MRFVEAGTGLVTSFLAADAADCEIYWTQSDHILGGDALPAVAGNSHLNTINAVAISGRKQIYPARIIRQSAMTVADYFAKTQRQHWQNTGINHVYRYHYNHWPP